MNVVDIMTADPITILPQATLKLAFDLMDEHHFMHLPVVTQQNHLIGVISDRDCRQALNSPYMPHEQSQDEQLINTIQIRAIMTPAPIIIEPSAPAINAAYLMLGHQIGCLPVMRSETLVGIVTRSDILIAFIKIYSKVEALTSSPNSQ